MSFAAPFSRGGAVSRDVSSRRREKAASRPGRLSYLASRTVEREGEWVARAVEGALPRRLFGTLYRNGPGQKESFAAPLAHLFDGDAYLTAIRFAAGRVSGSSRFLLTQERKAETEAGRMRYHEFGTRCRGRALGFKNPPSVNVFAMSNGHYALSESAPPVLFDPRTLECQGRKDFAGSWPSNATFTAHPKRDPVSGDVFAFGVTMSVFPELVLGCLPNGGEAFRIISRTKLGGFYPVHDFMLTEKYIIVAVPPVYVSMWGLARGRASIADNLVCELGMPLRFLIFRKDAPVGPVVVECRPASMIFHHCNAVESDGGRAIRLISMETDACSGFELLAHWGRAVELPRPQSQMTEFLIDLNAREVRRVALLQGAPIEFPAIDNRSLGRRIETIFALRTYNSPDDPLAFDAVIGWSEGKSVEARAGRGQVFGEPVVLTDVVGDTWIAHLGYDAQRDETFLDIREPEELALVARVWLGFRIPLGFHGCFVPDPCP